MPRYPRGIQVGVANIQFTLYIYFLTLQVMRTREGEAQADGKSVKIRQLGAVVQEVFLEEEATVAEALEAAGLDSDTHKARFNGETVEMDEVPEDGDELFVSSRSGVKGGDE
jgi:hypothetical protein